MQSVEFLASSSASIMSCGMPTSEGSHDGPLLYVVAAQPLASHLRRQSQLGVIRPERNKHYHKHKKMRTRLLCATALLILWLVPTTAKVTNDLSRLLPHTTNKQMGELPYTTTNEHSHVVDAATNRGAGQGQAAMPDLFQPSLAPQLLSQQQINHVAHLAELPHYQREWLALQATHSPDATVSGLAAPSTNNN